MTTLPKEVSENLSFLILSVDYDYRKIIIADNDFTNGEITLWLEDENNLKNTIDECLCIIIPPNEFASFIDKGNFNKYEGHYQRKLGSIFNGLIVINEPLQWYEVDATSFQQKCVREALLETLIKIVTG